MGRQAERSVSGAMRAFGRGAEPDGVSKWDGAGHLLPCSRARAHTASSADFTTTSGHREFIDGSSSDGRLSTSRQAMCMAPSRRFEIPSCAMTLAFAVAGCAAHPQSTPAALFSETVVDTAPGLSGLAVDDTGALWTIAERDRHAYRLESRGGKYQVAKFDVVGVPDGIDVEGIALLSPGHFALGGEGRRTAISSVLLAYIAEGRMVVTETLDLPASALGLSLEPNAGAEGICGFGDTVVVAIESNARSEDRRWSPVVELHAHAIEKVHKLWLATNTGTISALECRPAQDGIEVLAIERNFNETKILTFTIRPDTQDVTPTAILDLGRVLNNRLNLEGIVWLPDGSVAAVNDNDFKRVTGPSEVILFPAAVIQRALHH